MNDQTPDSAPLEETASAILDELGAIHRLEEEARGELVSPKANPRVLGSILHDFYTCCERVFRRISGEINGSTYSGDGWHKELLYRMTLAVEGLRPAVISQELAAELDEYLSFRHVFRSIYGFELQGRRVGRLAEEMSDIGDRFVREIEGFLKAIS